MHHCLNMEALQRFALLIATKQESAALRLRNIDIQTSDLEHQEYL